MNDKDDGAKPPDDDAPPPEPEKPAETPKPEADVPNPPPKPSEPEPTDEYDVVPDEAERTSPADYMRALGADADFTFGTVTSSGAAAFGPNAKAWTTVNMPGAKRPLWQRNVDPGVITELSDCYVRTGSDADLADLLDREGLACLTGKPGTGRKSSAVMALATRHGVGHVRRIDLDDDAPLNDITGDTITAERGFLLVASERSFPVKDLSYLAGIARHNRSSVVVVTAADDNASNRSVPHEVPVAAKVFFAHLKDQTKRRRRCEAECDDAPNPCGPTCFRELPRLCRNSNTLPTTLSAMATPRRAFNLAVEIAEKRPATTDELDKILNLQFRYKLEAARGHLALPNTTDALAYDHAVQRQAYLIAYAVLYRCPLTMVSQAASRLREISESAGRTASTASRGFGATFTSLIPEELRPDGDMGAGDLALFKDESMLPALLEVAWKDYPDSQRPLLKWLDALVGDPRATVRVRAAATAGFFAGLAPDAVLTELIDGWAGDRRARNRQAAALTCASAIGDPRVEPGVRRHLRDWISHRSDRKLDTVVRAYVCGLGKFIHIEQALRHLRIIAERPSQAENRSVPLALADLPKYHPLEPVIAELCEWTTGRDKLLQTHAARAVAELADLDITVNGGRQPALLHWMGTDPQRHDDLTVLWRHALLLQDTAYRAWQVLGTWVSQASFDTAMAEPTHVLIRQICRNRMLRRRLDFHLRRMWPIAIPESPLISRINAVTKGLPHASVSQTL